jgi:hypothetical protein
MRDNDTYDILDDDDGYRSRRGFWDEDADFRRRSRRNNKPLPSSGLGIASLVIGLIAGAIEFVNLVIAGILSQKQGGELDENSTEAMVVGLILFVGLFFGLIGGVLGIIGMVQANRAKGYAIAGLVVNSLVALGVLGIIVIGLLMG